MMYFIFFKVPAVFSLIMVVIQPSAVFEGLIVPWPKRVRGFIEAAMWENALELRTNSYDSKVIEDMLDENRSHY